MPELIRPDGAVVAYGEQGVGVPLLVLGPALGEVLSDAQAPLASGDALNSAFRVIDTDPRRWYAKHTPATPPTAADLAAHALALLDAAGADRALLFGTGGGAATALKLASDAPERIAGAVLQAPAGAEGPADLARFWAPFHETIRAVRDGGVEAVCSAAPGSAADAAHAGSRTLTEAAPLAGLFQDDLAEMTVERFATVLVRLRDAFWPAGTPFFSVSEAELRRCPVPLLVLPGADPMHPAAIARRICAIAPRARCLDAGWQQAAMLPQTIATVSGFLGERARS